MPKPVFTVLSGEETEQIHAAALHLLSEIGIYFEDKTVEKILLEAGCEARGGRILVCEELVKEALLKTPKSFPLYDREGRLAARLGEEAKVFNPGSAAVKILDYSSTEPRMPTLSDLRNFVKLVDALEYIRGQSTALVPGDVPVEVSDAVRLYVVLKYSSKPVVTGAFTIENLPLMVEMLAAVRADYRERPFAIFDVCPSPPLSWSAITSRNLVDLARLGAPAEIVAMPGLGANAPATVYGALAQHHAEVLSAVVIAQLASTKAKVIYGGSPTVIHPRFGTPMITAPEATLVSLSYRDMAKYVQLPCHTYMGLADAKAANYQAGAEAAYTATLAALAGFDIVSGPGMLGYESIQSMEKLVLDNEICGIALRLARGFPISPGDVDLIREVVLAKRGNFMAHRSTLAAVRREIHVPNVWDTEPITGKKTGDLLDWAHCEVQRILREHEPLTLEVDKLKDLDRVLSKLWSKVGGKPPQV
ncbi:MAG: trimethylamine methyltransferase family protein [Thermofilaceae archaeon]